MCPSGSKQSPDLERKVQDFVTLWHLYLTWIASKFTKNASKLTKIAYLIVIKTMEFYNTDI